MNVLKVAGKELILKYNFRALTELQERGIDLTVEREFKLKDVVTVLQIGLKKFQPELDMDNVFDLMDDLLEVYTLTELMGEIQKALEKSMGKQKPNPTQKVTK